MSEGDPVSQCDLCGKLWPSAPAGYIHKCQCSGGYCYPVPSTNNVSRIALSIISDMAEHKPRLIADAETKVLFDRAVRLMQVIGEEKS